MTMSPGQILDARADLMRRLKENDSFQFMAATYMALHQDPATFDPEGTFFGDQSMPSGDEGERRKDLIWERYGDTAPRLHRALEMTECYRVTADMSLMIEHAAKALDALDRFDPQQAPTPFGFVRFDKPLEMSDLRGKQMLCHWMAWMPMTLDSGATGIALWLWNDLGTKPDEVWNYLTELPEWSEEAREEYNRQLGRWAYIGISAYVKDQRMGPVLLVPDEWDDRMVRDEGFMAQPSTNGIRLVTALWNLMNQTIVAVHEEKPERPAQRRAKKMGLPSRVTVVRLRRESSDYRERSSESTVDWQHRWVVRGHWRWQACGENYPGAQEQEPGVWRARLWISPYVKGPDGAPFVQSEKVYSLER